jgi:sugar O-acyltransferase (sialic acid O-acetyltransferase NeuD family)
MKKSELIIIGAGGHSRSCIDAIEQEGKFEIGGLVGLSQELGSSQFGYEVIATDSELDELARQFQYAFVAIGQIHSPEPRIRIYEEAKAAGFVIPSIIAPSAYVSPHARIGAGTIVMQKAVLNAGVLVGNNCIINTRALLEHDSRVSDHCHISTGAILNGDTSIGTGSFIGSGSIVKEGVSVGVGSWVGMGLALRHNLGDGCKHLGEVKS